MPCSSASATARSRSSVAPYCSLSWRKFDAILTRSNTSRERSLTEIQTLAAVLAPPPLPQPVCRDADDDAVLALAVAAQVDFIVSGDDDLLSLQAFQHNPILTPAEALRRIEAEK